MATLASKQHLRQGFVVVNGAGHPEEFLHRVHHFGRFCSQQFAIQDQDLRQGKGKRLSGLAFIPVANCPCPLQQEWPDYKHRVLSILSLPPTPDILYQRYPCSVPAH